LRGVGRWTTFSDQEGVLHAIGRAKKAKGGQGASVVDTRPLFFGCKESKTLYFSRFIKVDNSDHF